MRTGDYKYFECGCRAISDKSRKIFLILDSGGNKFGFFPAERVCDYLSSTEHLAQIHHQQFRLGHFFNCVAQTFAAQAGVFDSAIGHLIDAERWNIARHQSAYFQFVIRLKKQFYIPREQTRLQAIVGVVDSSKGFVKTVIGLNSDDRAENLLAIHLHFGLGPGQHRRFDDGTLSSTTAQQTSSGADRLVDPVSNADRVTLADQRTEIGRFLHGVAGFQFFYAIHKKIDELAVDGLLDQDALHRNTGLASVAEATGNAAFSSVGKIGIAVNNGAGVATKFQSNFLFAGAALDIPAHRHAAGEADQLDALVSDQQASVVVRKRKHVEAAIGPARLLHAFRE